MLFDALCITLCEPQPSMIQWAVLFLGVLCEVCRGGQGSPAAYCGCECTIGEWVHRPAAA